MTPSQYLVSVLTPIVTSNNPGASSDEITAYVNQLVAFYIIYILPNLLVNLTTGAVNFIVPSS